MRKGMNKMFCATGRPEFDDGMSMSLEGCFFTGWGDKFMTDTETSLSGDQHRTARAEVVRCIEIEIAVEIVIEMNDANWMIDFDPDFDKMPW